MTGPRKERPTQKNDKKQKRNNKKNKQKRETEKDEEEEEEEKEKEFYHDKGEDIANTMVATAGVRGLPTTYSAHMSTRDGFSVGGGLVLKLNSP